MLQPALFGVGSVHTILDDSRARMRPEDGGLGYNPPFDTLSGFCFQVLQWNSNIEGANGVANGKIDATDTGVGEVLEKAVVPALRKA